jgi:hypothetical protein
MALAPITPAQLQIELGRLGYEVTGRTLVDWRAKGLLPPLRARGRGRGGGKEQFWLSPRIIDHAVAVSDLLSLRYPNDEARTTLWFAGFPIAANAVRAAWLSRLGKIEAELEKDRKKQVEDRKSEFPDVEDEISAVTSKYARKIAKTFNLDRQLIAQPVIDLFGLTFRPEYFVDANIIDGLCDLYPFIKKYTSRTESLFTNQSFQASMKFLKENGSLYAIKKIVASASDEEICHAQRRWRALLTLCQRAVPDMMPDHKSAKFVAAKVGTIIVPAIIRFSRAGKSTNIDATIVEISAFALQHDIGAIFNKLIRENQIGEVDKLALSRLLGTLSRIWDHKGFPFSLSPT